jgi:sigma-B regulation protein RsbU (phosphoserine phosphatase)
MKMKKISIVSVVFLVVALAIQFAVSYNRERTNLENDIERRMELAEKDFVFEVYDMYDATDEITYFFPELCDNTEELYSMLKTVLGRFQNLYGCYVAFVPDSLHGRERRFSPFASRAEGDSISAFDASMDVNYPERDWYKGAMQSDEKGYWSLPYHDGIHNDLVFSHSRKVYDKKGRMVGVAGADYTLSWTKHKLEDIKPYGDAVCQLYSTNGTLIVESGEGDMDGMIVMEKTLSPLNMRLVIGVPNNHVWKSVRGISLLTLAVLLTGIIAAGWLIRRIQRDHEAYARTETAKKLMEKELQIASNIQRGILRAPAPDGAGAGAEVQATLVPMREVGGDLYDYYRKGDDFFFIIGDVSGKGIPAALFMSATVNLFRSAVKRLQSPKAIMEEINGVLSEHNPSLTFVTAIIGRLHVPTGELTYCNAGHLPPIKVNGERCEEVELIPNIPLGYEGKFQFVEQGTLLGKEDTLVLYTDGITEARNKNHEMMGMARWKDCLNVLMPDCLSAGALMEGVKAFIGTAEQSDDITLMTISKRSDMQPYVLHVENKMSQWPVLRKAIHDYGMCVGMEDRTLKKMILALEEAVVNIVNYSEAKFIGMTISCGDTQRLSITLRDDGIAFDPTAQAEVDTAAVIDQRQIGGLGIALLRQIADEVHYRRTDDGQNELSIIKNI